MNEYISDHCIVRIHFPKGKTMDEFRTEFIEDAKEFYMNVLKNRRRTQDEQTCNATPD